MRIEILIMSSLLLLAFFAINARSVDSDNPDDQSVDQMIAGRIKGWQYLQAVQLKLDSRRGRLRLDSRERIF